MQCLTFCECLTVRLVLGKKLLYAAGSIFDVGKYIYVLSLSFEYIRVYNLRLAQFLVGCNFQSRLTVHDIRKRRNDGLRLSVRLRKF